MKGATAEPWVSATRVPNSASTATIGPSHHFFLSRMNATARTRTSSSLVVSSSWCPCSTGVRRHYSQVIRSKRPRHLLGDDRVAGRGPVAIHGEIKPVVAAPTQHRREVHERDVLVAGECAQPIGEGRVGERALIPDEAERLEVSPGGGCHLLRRRCEEEQRPGAVAARERHDPVQLPVHVVPRPRRSDGRLMRPSRTVPRVTG
jgi:hypothetical protein